MEPDDLLRDLLGDAASNVIFEPGDIADLEQMREVRATRHGSPASSTRR